MTRRPPAMVDVAKLAGVSHQTVSRVINGHPVREETRTRVRVAMRELGFRPNAAARNLVTRKSRTIGLMTVDSMLYGPTSMVFGIEQAARAAGYFVSIASARWAEPASAVAAIERLYDQAVEGILVIAPNSAVEAALPQAPSDLAIVAVGVSADAVVTSVGGDNAAGAQLATRHLLDLGHDTVHHIGGPDEPGADERVDGWRRALEGAGATVPGILRGGWTAKAGYESGGLLARDPSVTAIFCANDHVALGAINALHEAGRRVPDDVSVVGFDDVPEAAYYLPPLTTVRQDFDGLGRRSLSLLVEQMAGAAARSERILLAPELVVRESTTRQNVWDDSNNSDGIRPGESYDQ